MCPALCVFNVPGLVEVFFECLDVGVQPGLVESVDLAGAVNLEDALGTGKFGEHLAASPTIVLRRKLACFRVASAATTS